MQVIVKEEKRLVGLAPVGSHDSNGDGDRFGKKNIKMQLFGYTRD